MHSEFKSSPGVIIYHRPIQARSKNTKIKLVRMIGQINFTIDLDYNKGICCICRPGAVGLMGRPGRAGAFPLALMAALCPCQPG